MDTTWKGEVWKAWSKMKGKNTRMTRNLWEEVTEYLTDGHLDGDETMEELLCAINYFAYYFAEENRIHRMTKKALLSLAEEYELDVDDSDSRNYLIDEHIAHIWENAY